MFYLFEELYLEVLYDYHYEFKTNGLKQGIEEMFDIDRKQELDEMCKKLVKYKYPIDYLRSG